jgi:hypothetical protein
LRITNCQEYLGVFKDRDGSFQIMVDEGDRYIVYRLHPDQRIEVDAVFLKSKLGNPDVFPEAIGKFVPELISLEEPITVAAVPSYREANSLLVEYFKGYGVEFI